MKYFDIINMSVMLVFVLCCFYQLVYIPVSWWKKPPKTVKAPERRRFAVLIAARNEEIVIGQLIESLKKQDYPAELIKIYVMADNCTDRTAEIARECGAVVYERFDRVHIGKGYVMHELIERMKKDGHFSQADAFFIFDADNILRENYISEMNKVLSNGYSLVTGYRNSKNFGDNWITAGVGLWFLRETRYLNYPRYLIGSSAAIGGTGFCFKREVIEYYGGWNFFTLTEDLEFTSCLIRDGYKIGFCREAELYDEQPSSFRQSWRQRLRWSRGYMQMLTRYAPALFVNMFSPNGKNRFASFDVLMNILPAIIMTIVGLFLNAVHLTWLAVHGAGFWALVLPLLKAGAGGYLTMFALGAVTMISEWKHVHTTAWKKILYCFTFPIFMATTMPISIQAFFCKVEWKPIHHTRALNREQIERG